MISTTTNPSTPAGIAAITERELQILRFIALGYTYQQIADELQIGYETVDSHLRRAYKKLGVNSRMGAIIAAYKHHLID